MKIICTQENLKQGLSTTGRIISNSNTLPILNNILLKTENGMLKIASTNLEVAITTHIRCKVEEEGEITVYAKTISDLVSNLPNQNVVLESKNGQLNIEMDNNHTNIKTLPAEEFPLIPKVEKNHVFNLDAQELKKAIDQTVFAAANNQTQPEISGVLLGFEEGQIKIVATDRYRLAERKISFENKEHPTQEAIIPQKTILELSRVVGNQKGKVGIIVNETQISMQFNETEIISRLIDGQYPDYKQIIPANFPTSVLTERLLLVGALKSVGIFSQSTNSVKLEFSAQKQKLNLSAESSELGKSTVELDSKIEGKDGSLVLNFHYVLDALMAMDSKNAIIKVIDENSPSLIVPEEKNNYVYLVMPIKS